MELRRRLTRAYLANHPLQAARTMESLDTDALAAVLADADDQAGHALHLMDPLPLAAALDRATTGEAARLLRLMSLDTQLAVLPLARPATRERVLASLDEADAGLLTRLLSYPQQTAASLVEHDTFRVPADITAGEALERSRRATSPVRYYVYVTNRGQQLVGVVSLKQLLRGGADTPITRIMHERPASLAATATAAEVTGHIHWRRFPMLPVVDPDQRLLGVLLYETIQKLREAGPQDSGWVDARGTLMALGEVYWLGLASLLGAPPGQHARR